MTFKYHFNPHWGMFLLTLGAVILFMQLGFWQLARADEKKQMIAAVDVLSKQQPIDWGATHRLPKQYQRLHVQGHFLPTVFLLDNQHYRHQLGYDVLSPLLLDNGKVVLVDRGWVVANQDHRELPSIKIPNQLIDLVGSAYYPSDKTWVLGQVLEKKDKNMAIIEQIDMPIIRQFLLKSVYPFIIRLSPQAEHGFVRDWPVVAMSIERHFGYALQWFAIALVIIILFIVLNVKKKI